MIHILLAVAQHQPGQPDHIVLKLLQISDVFVFNASFVTYRIGGWLAANSTRINRISLRIASEESLGSVPSASSQTVAACSSAKSNFEKECVRHVLSDE